MRVQAKPRSVSDTDTHGADRTQGPHPSDTDTHGAEKEGQDRKDGDLELDADEEKELRVQLQVSAPLVVW